MRPTIENGDYILAKRYKVQPISGSIAVINHPILGTLVKRINFVNKTRKFVASGDNKFSIGPLEIGEIKEEEILYQAKWRISPSGISRLLVFNSDEEQLFSNTE